MKADINEKILLQGLATNNRTAIEAIYKENYNTIQALIINNNGTADDAKDVFQEAMMVLYQKAKTNSFELNCGIKTYVYAVSRRLWLKRLLHQNRFTITSDHEEVYELAEEDLEEHQKRDADYTMMEKAIGMLGEPCKSLLEAFYTQKKTMLEIAADFGYTNAENAKTQKYKCLMRLKKIFFTHYKTEP